MTNKDDLILKNNICIKYKIHIYIYIYIYIYG